MTVDIPSAVLASMASLIVGGIIAGLIAYGEYKQFKADILDFKDEVTDRVDSIEKDMGAIQAEIGKIAASEEAIHETLKDFKQRFTDYEKKVDNQHEALRKNLDEKWEKVWQIVHDKK